MALLLHYESLIRLGCFLAALALLAGWEWRRPRRIPTLSRHRRWPANLGLVLVDSLALRWTLPLLAVGAAVASEAHGWGLFHRLDMPFWPAFIISLPTLDLAIYAQHVAFHKIPLLWRLHRVHHSDTHIDVTTGLRFHPFEILLSMLFKIGVVTLVGMPTVAVLLFEVILNVTAMFNHSNIQLPLKLDAWLRLLVVTPDMHRVHHSIHRDETDSNYGFNLPWWDRWFGTYRAQPRDGHTGMIIGLDAFRDERSVGLLWLLAQPFLKAVR